MKIWTRLENYQAVPDRPLILALGNFDGVHQGHQKILEGVIERSKEKKGLAAVLTFSEHPQRVLHRSNEPALLTSPQHRLFLFREMGIDLCFLLPFTIPFSKTAPEAFVEEWLVERLQVRELHLGYNAHFGFDRRGDARLMETFAKRLKFDLYESRPIKVEEEFVSSSLIRRLIQAGDLNRTEQFLGRPFSIFASVVRGSGRGKDLGFPTANLKPHSEILPPRGVYPVEAREIIFHLKPAGRADEFEYHLETVGGWKCGILNYGVRPTFKGAGEAIPEVFLFDFTGDLYGKTMEVVFHPRLREETIFEGPRELAQAIEKDAVEARRYFASNSRLYKQRETGYTEKRINS